MTAYRPLSEAEIQAQIIEYLTLRQIFHWRSNTGAAKYSYQDKDGQKKDRFVRYGSPGVADIIGIYRSRMLAIEVKSVKGRLEPEQRAFLENVKAHGGIAILARSLEDVQEVLR